jgi:hypothetical protein
LESFVRDNYYHFSSKITNSNASPVGIRLGKEDGLDLPYIAVRTVIIDNIDIPRDYIVNLQSKTPKAIRVSVDTRRPSRRIPVVVEPEEDLKKILAAYDAASSTKKESGTDSVPPRLSQMLLPRLDGGYVCITPLGSAGLASIIRESADDINQIAIEDNRGKVVTVLDNDSYGIGGANAVNVGSIVNRVKPLLFNSPQNDPGIKKALGIYYRGFSPTVSYEAVKRYSDWLDKVRSSGSSTWTLRLKRAEIALVAHILKGLNRQSAYASSVLLEHREYIPYNADIPDDELLAKAVKRRHLSLGWLFPVKRSFDWKEMAADWLFDCLQNYKLAGDRKLGIGIDDHRRIVNAIKEAL